MSAATKQFKNGPKNYFGKYFKLISCIWIIVMYMQLTDGAVKIVQERAVVKFMNTKYISDVQVFTARRRRSENYRTNMTATIHQAWGNNVTFKMSYMLDSGNSVDLYNRVCDAVDRPWMLEFVKMFSNLTQCPVLPGRYRYFNVEIPPKNFPLPLPNLKKGDTAIVNAGFILTASKEQILDMQCTLRVR